MQVAGYYASNGYIDDIVIDTNDAYAYLATMNEGLEIIDLENTFNPYRIGQYIGNNYSGFSHIKLFEDMQKVYLKDGSKWDIVDIGDPTEPEHEAYMEDTSIYGGDLSPYGVIVEENSETIKTANGNSGSLNLILYSNIDVNLTMEVIVSPENKIDIGTYVSEITLYPEEKKIIHIPYTVMEDYDKPVEITINFSNENIVLKKKIYMKIE